MPVSCLAIVFPAFSFHFVLFCFVYSSFVLLRDCDSVSRDIVLSDFLSLIFTFVLRTKKPRPSCARVACHKLSLSYLASYGQSDPVSVSKIVPQIDMLRLEPLMSSFAGGIPNQSH